MPLTSHRAPVSLEVTQLGLQWEPALGTVLARSHYGECTWPLSPSLQHLSSPRDTDTQEKGRTSGIQALSRHESPAELSWGGSPSMQAPEGRVTSVGMVGSSFLAGSVPFFQKVRTHHV